MELMMIVGTAASAVGTAMSGVEQSRAAAFEQQQYKIQEQQYKTAAAQDEAKRRKDLSSTIDTIQAIRAGRGVGQGSPTGTAILTDITGAAESDILTSKTNLLGKADQSRQASEMAERKKRMALFAGDLGTLASIGQGAAQYRKYA